MIQFQKKEIEFRATFIGGNKNSSFPTFLTAIVVEHVVA